MPWSIGTFAYMKSIAKSIVCTVVLSLPFVAAQAKIKVGQKAPDFVCQTSTRDSVSITGLRHKKILLAFFRYAGCPVCNYRMHELIQNYDRIRENGFEIIAVFESDNLVLQKYTNDTSIPFPVIGDPHHILYKKYHVNRSFWKTLKSAFSSTLRKEAQKGMDLFHRETYKRDGSLSRIPADFIIDENGTIQQAYYGNNIGDHLPLHNILNPQIQQR